MDVLRRNTDYALRIVVHLARQRQGEPASSRDISAAGGVSYNLTCKLLQKLAKKRLVKSTMGPKGGFELWHTPDKITIAQVIKSVQGPIKLNRCLLGGYKCPRKGDCPVYKKIAELQEYIDEYFNGVTLADLIKTNGKRIRKRKKK
jgi:Rrf2 family protein